MIANGTGIRKIEIMIGTGTERGRARGIGTRRGNPGLGRAIGQTRNVDEIGVGTVKEIGGLEFVR